MGQVIQTNGDYNIKTREGATIILDTGPNVGEVKVTGNLIIAGTSTEISTDNLAIKDNIIVVNKNEIGPGVTLRYAGLKVDRGPQTNNVAVLWDENLLAWSFVEGNETSGFAVTDTGRLIVSEIRNIPDANLNLIGDGLGVISVTGTTNYENQVVDDDHIPNKKYVDDTIVTRPSFQLRTDDTSVTLSDKDTPSGEPGSLESFIESTGYTTFGESAVSIVVDGDLTAQFYSNRAEIGDLEIGGGSLRNEITSKTSITNENIFVRTQGTGKLQTNYAIQYDHIVGNPASVTGTTVVFAKTPDTGTSGLFFVNSASSGELISKNKALVFSMIF